MFTENAELINLTNAVMSEVEPFLGNTYVKNVSSAQWFLIVGQFFQRLNFYRHQRTWRGSFCLTAVTCYNEMGKKEHHLRIRVWRGKDQDPCYVWINAVDRKRKV